ILVVGTFPPESGTVQPGKFLQKTSESVRTAFEQLGHSVDIFDYRRIEEENRRWKVWEYRFQKYLKAFQKPFFPSFLRTAFFRIPGIRKMNTQLLETVKNGNYNLVILLKSEKVDYRIIPEIRTYSPVWYFFTDWIVIAREVKAAEYAKQATWASATRSNVADVFTRAGANARFLTQGANRDYFYPEESIEKTHDVTFVGTITPEREAYIKKLASLGITVQTFGRGGEHGHVFGKDLAELYRRSKIVLNFNITVDNTGFSLRVFEVMGSGAFLLTEYCKDLETLFKNGNELVWFHNPDECAEMIHTYLKNDENRERIARAGTERVAGEFTWKHIIQKICDEVSDYKDNQESTIK
ncbi:glycosyltransferase, partial [Planctomycetota bacterium]